MRNPFGEVHKAEYDDNGFFCVRDTGNHLCCKIYSKSQAKFLVAAINGYEATETKLKGYATLLGSANNDVKQLSKYADELEAKIADQQAEIKQLEKNFKGLIEIHNSSIDLIEKLHQKIADQQAEIAELKKMLADNPTQSDMDAAQFMINLQQKQIADQQAEIAGYKEWGEDIKRLTKEISDILHPKNDGPKQPSLCDVVAYVRNDFADQRVKIDRLEKREQKLNALEAAGVDNWEWYGDAMDILNKNEEI